MDKLTFPSTESVAEALEDVRSQLDMGSDTEVRLQVYPTGQWAVRWGLSDYDQDHRGYWGASSLFQWEESEGLRTTAEFLIDQAKEQAAYSGVEVDE